MQKCQRVEPGAASFVAAFSEPGTGTSDLR
jgi:hypothetical protein